MAFENVFTISERQKKKPHTIGETAIFYGAVKMIIRYIEKCDNKLNAFLGNKFWWKMHGKHYKKLKEIKSTVGMCD